MEEQRRRNRSGTAWGGVFGRQVRHEKHAVSAAGITPRFMLAQIGPLQISLATDYWLPSSFASAAAFWALSAKIESCGLAPMLVGNTEPSMTKRLAI